MINAYPLQWPEGWARTKPGNHKEGRFTRDNRRITVIGGVERVLIELERLGVGRDDIVISTNLKTRLDGLPRSDQAKPNDCGTAAYWERKGKRHVMAIDRYYNVADNLAAIAATLEAMRAIERHGGARILERAFTGFTALAAPGATKPWWEVLGLPKATRDLVLIRQAFRLLARSAHPDRGGTHDAMTALNAALAQAEKELGGNQ